MGLSEADARAELTAPALPREARVAVQDRTGGVRALAALGQPAQILRETKERLFAA